MSPVEHLIALEQQRGAYQKLLEKHGGQLYLAAHELASMKCRAYPIATSVPTAREVHVAAREIDVRSDYTGSIPSIPTLRNLCVAHGLQVI